MFWIIECFDDGRWDLRIWFYRTRSAARESISRMRKKAPLRQFRIRQYRRVEE